jgi:hypothetical protein
MLQDGVLVTLYYFLRILIPIVVKKLDMYFVIIFIYFKNLKYNL